MSSPFSSSSSSTAMAAALGGGSALLLLALMSNTKKKQNAAPSKLQVFGFMPLGADPDSSPACIKLLTFLKMTNTEYDYIACEQHQYSGSPRTKVPWVHSAILNGGVPIGDSNVIIDQLKALDPSKYDLDQHLTLEQVAIGTAFKVMMEESMYWYLIQMRWNSREFENCTVPTYFGHLTFLIQKLIAPILRPKILRDLKGQGYGLLTEDEVLAKMEKEVSAVSTILGAKQKYFLGDKVTSYDATAYAYLAVLIQGGWQHKIKQTILEQENLVAYVERMRQEFFPELQPTESK